MTGSLLHGINRFQSFFFSYKMSVTLFINHNNRRPQSDELHPLGHIVCTNPRARDGKNLIFIEPECTRFLFPWHRISFIETYPSDEDRAEVETFFRD